MPREPYAKGEWTHLNRPRASTDRTRKTWLPFVPRPFPLAIRAQLPSHQRSENATHLPLLVLRHLHEGGHARNLVDAAAEGEEARTPPRVLVPCDLPRGREMEEEEKGELGFACVRVMVVVGGWVGG